jgi:thiol:disulfide interchange protein
MNTGKVILGIIFLVIGIWLLIFVPAFSITSDGTVVIHYLEIISGFLLTALGIFNIVTGRKNKA